MWASSTALLTFVLCLLSLHCACAFPAPRTAPKSARQDDLISGSDFLSVFIGASSRKAGSRPRDATVLQQEDGNSDIDSMIEAFSSESSGFGTRTKPRGEGASSPRSNKDPMSLIFDVENTRDKGGLDEVGEVSTTPEDITSTLPQDYKPSRKKETPKHFPRTFTSNRDILKSLPHSEDSTDFNSNAPETSTVPEFYRESTTSKSSSVTIILENQEAAADEQGTESVNTPANEFTTDQSNYFTEAATFNPDQQTTTDIPLNDEFAEISRLSELTDIKKINQPSPRPTVITKSKRLHSNSAPGNEYYTSATSADILREDAQRTSESPTFYEVHQENISLLPRNKTHQVISVRVSSTVVLAPGHTTSRIQDTTKEENTEQDKEILKKYVDAFSENADYNGVQPPGNSISLVTEEQPAATAIQRSQFIVEESQPSSSEVATFPNKPSDLSQHQSIYVATSSHSTEPLPDPQTHPVSYQTSISSATSGSRVQFYSEPPNYRKPSSMAESVQRTVVTSHQHQPVQESRFGQKVHTSVGGQGTQFGRSPSGEQYAPQQPASFSVAVNRYQHQQQAPKKDNPDREQKSYHGNAHQEPVEQNYEQPEQNYGTPERVYGEPEKNYEEPEMNYGMPEENYEVDEAVSVMSNGRVHGVQTPSSVTPHNTDHGTTPVTAEQNDPNHKFGYVVEGRNFRKYRVEERTPDGFIVGEYGVVSHDDGSLRGVRYTADSTINPKLIYEALVKFLSL